MLRVARKYYNEENAKLEKLKKYSQKVVYLNNKAVSNLNNFK